MIGEQTADLDQSSRTWPTTQTPGRGDEECKTQVTLPQNLRRRRSNHSHLPVEASEASTSSDGSEIYLQASMRRAAMLRFCQVVEETNDDLVPLSHLAGGMVEWWHREKE